MEVTEVDPHTVENTDYSGEAPTNSEDSAEGLADSAVEDWDQDFTGSEAMDSMDSKDITDSGVTGLVVIMDSGDFRVCYLINKSSKKVVGQLYFPLYQIFAMETFVYWFTL